MFGMTRETVGARIHEHVVVVDISTFSKVEHGIKKKHGHDPSI